MIDPVSREFPEQPDQAEELSVGRYPIERRVIVGRPEERDHVGHHERERQPDDDPRLSKPPVMKNGQQADERGAQPDEAADGAERPKEHGALRRQREDE